jgi:hypothetical protein
MSLARHAAVLWRFRAVMVVGLLLGLLLAILASYKPTFSGGPKLEPRGSETWTSDSALLVTQPGFPEGRVVLPTAAGAGAAGAAGAGAAAPVEKKGAIKFADPNRFTFLADFYTQMAGSDQVRRRIPGKPKPEQIQVSLVPGTAGTPVLPIIKLTTNAGTAAAARALNVAMMQALRSELAAAQAKNGIAAGDRVQLASFNAASTPILTAARSRTASILALMLAIIGSIAVAHILASLRPGTEAEGEPLGEVYDPWNGDGPVALAPDARPRNGSAEAVALEPEGSREVSGMWIPR